MNRRTFIKSTAISGIGLGFGGFRTSEKTHILTLSFDDGFKRSFYKIAELYEDHGLSACFNVIASGHLPGFKKVDDWILPKLLGDFDDWNMLKSRGHEVMPHSWQHLNLAKQPLNKAKDLIMTCLTYFEDNLDGYTNEEAVFNFPFNSSTPKLEAFVLSKVMALRSRGLPNSTNTNVFRQACKTYGPKNIDDWVDNQINSFLNSEGGWLILNTHGLDNEGWGPLSTKYLKTLLSRLTTIDNLDIMPTGQVLKMNIE